MSAADPAASAAFLARLERQIRRGLARGSEVRQAGGAFRLYLWPRPEPFYRNRALPVAAPDGGDWRPSVAAMLAAFAEAGREPRLEFFAERWPDLPAALETAGLRRELEAPVLAANAPPPDGSAPQDTAVRLLGPGMSRATRRAFLAGAQAAFGHGGEAGEPDAGEVEQLGRDLDDGATLVAARMEGDEPVAGASLIGIGAEAELAGVWTAPGHRRRGHAAAVCAALTRRFFAAGGELVWLTAGGDGSERLYRRLGFERVGTQLDYGPAREG